MTDGYRALLALLAQPAVNVDRVRQRLRGEIGVNPGDQMRFTVELLQKMFNDTKDKPLGDQFHTMVVTLKEVRLDSDGYKVLVLDVHNKEGMTAPLSRHESATSLGALIKGVVA